MKREVYLMLIIKDLRVEVEGKEILKGLSLTVKDGMTAALMGPNGSGKSTLANTVMGHPKYVVTSGSITFNGVDITQMGADERAKAGLFLSFQYPHEVSGVTISNFLRTAYNAVKDDKIGVVEFQTLLADKMQVIGMSTDYLKRYLNEGFSGGEKKKAEILQLLVLDPLMAILDETDSGLDIDALRIVSEGVNLFKTQKKSVLVITHYKRILEYIKPDKVFIMKDGIVVDEGDGSLVDKLESEGYGWLNE